MHVHIRGLPQRPFADRIIANQQICSAFFNCGDTAVACQLHAVRIRNVSCVNGQEIACFHHSVFIQPHRRIDFTGKVQLISRKQQLAVIKTAVIPGGNDLRREHYIREIRAAVSVLPATQVFRDTEITNGAVYRSIGIQSSVIYSHGRPGTDALVSAISKNTRIIIFGDFHFSVCRSLCLKQTAVQLHALYFTKRQEDHIAFKLHVVEILLRNGNVVIDHILAGFIFITVIAKM